MKQSKKKNLKNKTLLKRRPLEILYQKMGDRWFAFSLINNEVFMGSISQFEIDYQTYLSNAEIIAQIKNCSREI